MRGRSARRTAPRSGRRSASRRCSGRPWPPRAPAAGSPSTAARHRRGPPGRGRPGSAPRTAAAGRRPSSDGRPARPAASAPRRRTPSGRLVIRPSLTTLAEMTRGVPVSREWITWGAYSVELRVDRRAARASRQFGSHTRSYSARLSSLIVDVLADVDAQPLDLARRGAGTTGTYSLECSLVSVG